MHVFAAGRFSMPGLNPSQRLGDLQIAYQVIGDFGLRRLRSDVMRLLPTTKSNQLKSQLCQTLIKLNGDVKARSIFEAGAKLIGTSESEVSAESAVVDAIVEFDRKQVQELIMKATQTMPIGEQETVADLLLANKEGVKYQLELLEAGTVSTALLRNATVLEKFRAHQQGELKLKIDQLVERMPDTNP